MDVFSPIFFFRTLIQRSANDGRNLGDPTHYLIFYREAKNKSYLGKYLQVGSLNIKYTTKNKHAKYNSSPLKWR